MSLEELRVEALKLAQAAPGTSDIESVVERAKAYYAFLTSRQ